MTGDGDGGRIRLRPVRADDLGWLAALEADPVAIGEHNWRGEPVDLGALRAALRARFDHDGFLGHDGGRLLVVDDHDTRLGDIGWRTERWGPSEGSRCFAFGIALLPEHRGRGIGTRAQRMLIDHLFQTTPVHRIQSDTAVDNPAEQRALERAGMVREGVVRGAEWRGGRYHDHVVYGIVRPDWEAARRDGG